jgi:hypothetical protein
MIPKHFFLTATPALTPPLTRMLDMLSDGSRLRSKSSRPSPSSSRRPISGRTVDVLQAARASPMVGRGSWRVLNRTKKPSPFHLRGGRKAKRAGASALPADGGYFFSSSPT